MENPEESKLNIEKIRKAIEKSTDENSTYFCLFKDEKTDEIHVVIQGTPVNLTALVAMSMAHKELIDKVITVAYMAGSLLKEIKEK